MDCRGDGEVAIHHPDLVNSNDAGNQGRERIAMGSQSHRPDLINSNGTFTNTIIVDAGLPSQLHYPDLVNSNYGPFVSAMASCLFPIPTVPTWSIPTTPRIRLTVSSQRRNPTIPT